MSGLRTEIPWKTDAAGMMIGARAHDGHLFALSYLDHDNLLIKVRRASADLVEIKLQGVRDVGIVGFRNGAILADAFVWRLGKLSSANLDGMHGATRALFGHDLPPPDANAEVQKLIRTCPELFFAYFSCSYGGEVAATCEQVRVFEEALREPPK